MTNKLAVAFLWHMHQPMYKDLVTGKYYLPWVRLHSTHSYLDMASVLERFPEARATFNFTPSLIWQLKDLSENPDVDDKYLELSRKRPEDLTDEDKFFILKHFFSCDVERGISSFHKYQEFFFRRGTDLREEELIRKSKDFSAADFRDIQVFFNLSWCGFTLKEKDHLVKKLVHRAGGYTEDEKQALLDRQMEVVASILPLYKKLQDEGRIEVSTSPFYHPILPLLCRGRSGEGFDFTEDAAAQVARAIELYREVFGRDPIGMWPPEGSVSQEIIPVLAEHNIKWIATDESILLQSFKGTDIPREELLYNAFTVEEAGSRMSILFRDAHISNDISFKYAQMPYDKAAHEMFGIIENINRARASSSESHILSVILDGENPWSYYHYGGEKFLAEVYGRLSASRDVELVTIGRYLGTHKERKKINRLFSGSWIDHSFRKWIGSAQKDKAWEYLDKAREDLFAFDPKNKKALEELYIAEGSDWFWWYDDFGSELNFIFDDLFRMHLANIYTLMGKDVPYYLAEPISHGPVAQDLNGRTQPAEMAYIPKVLMVSSEVFPFAKTGGLADVAGSLPKALLSLGADVRVIMPLYKCVKDRRFELVKEASGVKHPSLTGSRGFNLYANRTEGITTYFVDNRRYFMRKGLYGTVKGDYPDNDMRFSFFSKAVLAAIKAIDFKPDIIHCNDWQSALIPFYLRFELGDDNFFDRIKTLFTIHNIAFQGVFSKRSVRRIGMPEVFFNMHDMEYYGKLNFMKSGMLYSDAINTVSHRYAEEIMTPEYGAGLDGLLRTRKEVVYGIPNGVDYSLWSPRNDHFITANYSVDTIDKKAECKKDLLKVTGLRLPLDMPLLGTVSRLTEQKGMDLLAGVMDRIVALGAGVVVLGRGDDQYNRLFASLMRKYPANVYVCNGFNDELAHKIEAGCDIFLMPSRFEPCGLNQMYSIKYGTIPVVRATGGLDDAIKDIDEDPEEGNGFKFVPATEEALLKTVERAVKRYKDRILWKKLMIQAMSYDFSWIHSAEQYMKLYRKIT